MRLSTISLAALALAPSALAHPDNIRRYVLPREERESNSTCKYASKSHIYDIWATSGGDFYRNFRECQKSTISDSGANRKYSDEQIDWDVMFTHPLSGHYSNLTQFFVNGLLRLANAFDGGFSFDLVNIIGGCDDPWSVEEILIQGTLYSGLKCDEVVVWATRWDETPRVVQARTYVDSRFTTDAILQNEASTNSSWRDVRTGYIPGPGGFPNISKEWGFTNADDAPPLTSTTPVVTKPYSNLNLPTGGSYTTHL